VQIATATDAARVLAPLFADARGERLAVAHLDAGRALLALDQPVAGGAAHVDLPIRAIIARAFDLDTKGLILAHNHPSGDPSPSRADIAATRRLAATADALGIRLFDHLIFAGGDCRSFRALGLL
jgi:DNA repair protein RadC